MADRCSICSHPEREAIERQLVAGASLRQLARQYETDKSALCRHKPHVAAAVSQARAADLEASAESLLDSLRDLQRRTLALLDEADRAGDRNTVLRAVREARANVELIGEFTGELNRRGGSTAIAVAASSATASVQAQLEALTDEELLEELEAAIAATRAKVAGKAVAS